MAKLQRYASERRGQAAIVALILAVSLIVRLLLSFLHGHGPDVALFGSWFDAAANNGLSSFYDNVWCDYPPFNVHIFWLFGKLAHALGQPTAPFFVKLPGNLFDLATAFLIFRFLRPRFSFKVALSVMALYAFNPATIFDLAVWGQLDSIYTFFMVASLYSVLRSKYALSGGLLALAILAKPQGIVLLPVVAYITLRNGGWQRALSGAAAFSIIAFVVILPFNWDNPIAFVLDRYLNPEWGYNYYAYNTVNAYNFWALFGFWKPDTDPLLGLTYQQWGTVAFGAFVALVMWQLHRRYEPRSAIFAVFLLAFGFFMLMTRMHERYLFSVFALLAMGWYTRFTIWLYLGLVVTFLANLAYVLSLSAADIFWIPSGHWSTYVLVPANIILFGFSIWTFCRMQSAKLPEVAEQPPPPTPRGISLRSPPYIVALLAIIYFSVSVWNLGDLRAPSSDWLLDQTPREVVVDLGRTARVDDIFLLKQRIETTETELYWGTDGNWTSAGSWSVGQSYRNHQWEHRSLGHETRYVRLLFESGSGRFGEIALFSSGHKLAISKITVDGNEATGVPLFDEQHLVCDQLSPTCDPRSHKSGIYFDEEHYVKTAEETLKLEEPTQWDHPPTSKLIMAAGIAVFGHNPFGWRIAGVIFATLMIPLIYDFARRMFNSPRAGLIAAFLLTFDFMHFAQARIATPDIFILFFVIAMFYFFYRFYQDPAHRTRDLFLSLVFFGLGFSTKWFVMWGLVGIVLLLVVLRLRKPFDHYKVFSFFCIGLLAAAAIYLLSYITYFLAGHDVSDFVTKQVAMYDFHSTLTATHGGSSEWYTWPLMLHPLWLYGGYFGDTKAYISSMGNPALWWASIPAMLAVLWFAVKDRDKTAIFILIPFLAQWLIFIAIGRCLFIYHFFPNVLFMILAITLCIERLWNRYEWGKWAVAAYLALNVACFAFLFPVISGLPMSNGYWDALNWLVNWAT